MKRILIGATVLFVCYVGTHAQSKKDDSRNAIGISVPIIYNNSNGVFYSAGNRKEPTGNAISYGINANFTRLVYKSVFITIGAGYFKQNFAISRPFNFDGDTIANLGYSTKRYSYSNFTWQIGLGYNYKVHEKLLLNAALGYTSFTSFKQYYLPTGLSGYQHRNFQENRKNGKIGSALIFSGGIEKKITNKLGIGCDVAVPVLTKWKNDEVFWRSSWGDDAQRIAENRFSFGLVFLCKYHF